MYLVNKEEMNTIELKEPLTMVHKLETHDDGQTRFLIAISLNRKY